MKAVLRVAPGISWRHLRFGAAAVLAAALSVPAPALAQQGELELHAYRFWRAPDLTLVEVFATIPLSLLPLERQGDEETGIYDATLTVRDASGLELTRQEWRDTITVPAMAAASRARASTSEHFSFQLKPGRYTVALEVRAGQGAWSASRDVEAYAAAPEHSDLVLAGGLNRLEDAAEAAPDALVRGTLEVIPNFAGVITSDRPSVGIYVEIYRDAESPDSAEVWLDIVGATRDFRLQTPKQSRVYPAGAGSEAFALSLAGLPPGRYSLGLNIDLPTDSLVLEHPLEVLAPGAGIADMAIEVPYQGMTSEQLDSIYAPMRYIARPAENTAFASLTDADAKRRFIARFWEERAGIGGLSATQLRQDWEQRVEHVNRNFATSVRGRVGWESDRGRIYLRFGAPVEQFIESQRQGPYNPWQVWKYGTGRGDRFVFLDRSGFGDYELVFSSERTEPTQPDWERFFSQESLEFIRSF